MHEDRLSPRELEIARAYALGDTYHRIAERLCIAPSTVRTHLAAIYRKLEVSSKLELHRMLDGAAPNRKSQAEQTAIISELALSLEEAISRERALSEILRIISGSEGQINEVIAALLGYALELCDAEFGILFDCTPPDAFRATYTRGIPQAFQDWFAVQGEIQAGPETGLGRMAASHEVVNIVDVRAEEIYRTGDPLRERQRPNSVVPARLRPFQCWPANAWSGPSRFTGRVCARSMTRPCSWHACLPIRAS